MKQPRGLLRNFTVSNVILRCQNIIFKVFREQQNTKVKSFYIILYVCPPKGASACVVDSQPNNNHQTPMKCMFLKTFSGFSGRTIASWIVCFFDWPGRTITPWITCFFIFRFSDFRTGAAER